MTPILFRSLLALSLLCGIAGASIDTLFPSLVPATVAQAIENEPLPSALEGLSLVLAVGVMALVVLVLIVSTIGLFFFKAWARALAFYSTVASLALYPLVGTSLSSNWAGAFTDASSYLWGAVLALAYFSPISNNFTQKRDT